MNLWWENEKLGVGRGESTGQFPGRDNFWVVEGAVYIRKISVYWEEFVKLLYLSKGEQIAWGRGLLAKTDGGVGRNAIPMS